MVNADGCHIGQKDMNFISARKVLGKNKIIGMLRAIIQKISTKSKKTWSKLCCFWIIF